MKKIALCATLAPCLSWAVAGEAGQPAVNGFPVIDAAVQRERDEMRKQILKDELVVEAQRLVAAKADLARAEAASKPPGDIGGLKDALRRHESNVASLNQELARMGPPPRVASPARKAGDRKAVVSAAPVVPAKHDGYRRASADAVNPYDGYAAGSAE